MTVIADHCYKTVLYDANLSSTSRREQRRPEREEQPEPEKEQPPEKRKKKETVETPLQSKTGGAYIPPAKLKMMQAQISDKSRYSHNINTSLLSQ